MSEAPEIIKDLVEKFERNLKSYKSPSYNEAQVRQEFINPFFKALGWDVDNEIGAAPQYRDVIFEDSIKVSGGTRAPDYCFTMSGRRMFFVEAKKPSVNIETAISPSYQLRRYAWSAKLPLSILTDFEELAVYESRTRPKKNERASTGRILLIKYTEYIDRWEEIYNIFSKEAVLKGSFDKYAESTRKKRGTSSVDDEFLHEIEEWRELLARNIALRNKEINIDELNFAVQQIIDRIVFLRMCEDRGIEKYEQLRDLLTDENIYHNFCKLCQKADEKYNSGLFHFKEEKGRNSHPDRLTLDLQVDDGVLKTIIKSLYYPNSPYEFSVLSADILGNVYEQFLGKVIRLTKGHQAKVEEKPEVKKAGGVYYTPHFIVEYIVENTVGKLCKGKTPNKVSEIKILDPACGSGSFLLGAYDYLLKWHVEYYLKKGLKRLSDKIYEGKNGQYQLTIQEKKRILLNNIYGVDIDPQAVEVTKLSLLLKVLEGENKDALEAQQKLFQERALPDLENNIKCGNSLIGPDIYNSDLELNNGDITRINPFDWNEEFSEIMTEGGFDAVIGNPPYIRIQAMKNWAPREVEFYKNKYISASKGNYDIYIVFVEKGLELLNEKGLLGFILPHKFFNAKYGNSLRNLIAEGKYLDTIIHFGHEQVFDNATTYTCLLFLSKMENIKFNFVKVDDLDKWALSGECIKGKILLNEVNNDEWNFIVGEGAELFKKMYKIPDKLKDITNRIFQGIRTSADKIYIVDKLEQKDNLVKIYSKQKDAEYWLESDLFHPLVKGRDSKRFNMNFTNRIILFPYAEQDDGNMGLIPVSTIKELYPLTYTYLKENKLDLEGRERGRMKGKKWYAYIYPKALDLMHLPKIFTPDIAAKASFSLDREGKAFFTSGYGVLVKPKYSREYILGLLNSKLIDWFEHKRATTFRGGYFSYESRFISDLPIVTIDSSNPDEVAIHDKIVSLVEQMIQLNKNLSNTNIPSDINIIQRQIDATDKQIDNLVYELYGLTDDEIRIVEDSLKD